MKLTQEELNIVRGVSIHRILNITNNGHRKMIRCPFHNERTASFALYPDNSYHCYGCGKHGMGAIDFCQDLGYNFKEALQELANYL